MRMGSSAFVLAVALLSGQAFADPLQKSEDIVKFFAGVGNLGASRGICVGTEDECKSKAETKNAPAQKTGLDMAFRRGVGIGGEGDPHRVPGKIDDGGHIDRRVGWNILRALDGVQVLVLIAE